MRYGGIVLSWKDIVFLQPVSQVFIHIIFRRRKGKAVHKSMLLPDQRGGMRYPGGGNPGSADAEDPLAGQIGGRAGKGKGYGEDSEKIADDVKNCRTAAMGRYGCAAEKR